MTIAYLVNQYPHTSHSFIRREIAALEAASVRIERISIRRAGIELADPADRAEARRTRVVLEAGVKGLLGAALSALAARPARFLHALRTTLRMGWRSDRGILRHLAYLAEACLVLRWANEGQVKHLHAHFGTNSAAVAMLCHMLGGPAFSFTAHGPEEFDRPDALGLGEKIARAAFVVAVSEYGRSQLYRWSGLQDWSKIHVVHCGVDESFLDVRPASVGEVKRLVCVGRLCEQKGQLLLLHAAARVAADGMKFELVLVGDGPMRQEIEQLIQRLSLDGTVRLAGWMSGTQVREEILAARAMVLPSFAEGLPVVLMEALALGRPVISTYIAGIPELVENGVSGWLVPAGSVEALATAMRAALEAVPQRLEEMGQAGRARVLECHHAAEEARKLAALFASSIAQGSDLAIASPGSSSAPAPAEVVSAGEQA